jgi:hypothetical protein
MKIEITYKGILLEVEGTYAEAEDRVIYYGDLDGNPGSPAIFDINAVFVQDVDIYELLSEDSLIEIETLILEEICG